MLAVRVGRFGGTSRSPRKVIISALAQLARTEPLSERALRAFSDALDSPDEAIRVVAAKAIMDAHHKARADLREEAADDAIDADGTPSPTPVLVRDTDAVAVMRGRVLALRATRAEDDEP